MTFGLSESLKVISLSPTIYEINAISVIICLIIFQVSNTYTRVFDAPQKGFSLESGINYSVFLGRLPKVDLIILEGENVRPYVRPSVHKKFLRFE